MIWFNGILLWYKILIVVDQSLYKKTCNEKNNGLVWINLFTNSTKLIINQTGSDIGNTMNNSATRGFKLTTVIFAVIIMTVSAMLSGNTVADDMDVEITQSEE